MFETIIRALGGFTNHEHELLRLEADSWRTRAIAAETTVALFKEIMQRREEAVPRYKEPENPQPPNMKPVGNTLSSWPRIKRELEKNDRVKNNAGVSREEIEKTIREG